MSIILRQFNLNYLPDNPLILIIGSSNSGKSTISKDILHHFNDIPNGIVISETNHIKSSFNYIPPIFIHDKFSKSTIKRFIKKQMSLINTEYDSRSFIIFENCLIKPKYVKDIIQSNKSLNYTCIIETTPILNQSFSYDKENIDYLFLTKEDFEINRRKIYEYFKDEIGIQYTLFFKLMDDYTTNHHFLIIDLKSKSSRLEDKVFWYKAKIHQHFIMCSSESWEYNNTNYIVEPPKKDIPAFRFY